MAPCLHAGHRVSGVVNKDQSNKLYHIIIHLLIEKTRLHAQMRQLQNKHECFGDILFPAHVFKVLVWTTGVQQAYYFASILLIIMHSNDLDQG